MFSKDVPLLIINVKFRNFRKICKCLSNILYTVWVDIAFEWPTWILLLWKVYTWIKMPFCFTFVSVIISTLLTGIWGFCSFCSFAVCLGFWKTFLYKGIVELSQPHLTLVFHIKCLVLYNVRWMCLAAPHKTSICVTLHY